MAYKITIIAPLQDRYIPLEGDETGRKVESWTIEPIETSIDMQEIDNILGKTDPADELFRHTIITNENDLAAVVAIIKAYHDCSVSLKNLSE